MLRERGKPILLAANKVDAKEGREGVSQFHALNVDTIHAVSAEHGTGVSELLEAIVARIPARTDAGRRPKRRTPTFRGSPWWGGRTWESRRSSTRWRGSSGSSPRRSPAPRATRST